MTLSEQWKNSKLWICVSIILIVVALIMNCTTEDSNQSTSQTYHRIANRQSIERFFKNEFNIRFVQTRNLDGVPYSTGECPLRDCVMDIIGPDNIIYRTTMVVDVRSRDAGTLLIGFLVTAVPTWGSTPEGVEWLADAMNSAHMENREIVKILEGGRVKAGVQITYLNGIEVVMLSFNDPYNPE